jgi:peptidoglycan/LPS O-acetylase OafA/YrhL
VARTHFTYISGIRGIAALLVLLFHLQLHLFAGYPERPIQAYSLTWWLCLGCFDLGKYAVALFFMVSGFLVPSTLRVPGATVSGFVRHRFFRLYPVYWLSIALQLLALLLLGRLAELNWPNVLANLTMAQGFVGQPNLIGVFWTLQIELVFYLVCVVLALSGRLDRPRLWNAVALGAALLLALLRNRTGHALPVAMPLAIALMFLADGLRQRGRASFDRQLALDLSPTLVALVPICLFAYPGEGLRYLLTYLMAIGSFLLCWRYLSQAPFTPRVCSAAEFLGNTSYAVYLTASVVMELVSAPLFHATDSRLLTTLVTIALTLGLASLIYRYVEAPSIRLGRRTGRPVSLPSALSTGG